VERTLLDALIRSFVAINAGTVLITTEKGYPKNRLLKLTASFAETEKY